MGKVFQKGELRSHNQKESQAESQSPTPEKRTVGSTDRDLVSALWRAPFEVLEGGTDLSKLMP